MLDPSHEHSFDGDQWYCLKSTAPGLYVSSVLDTSHRDYRQGKQHDNTGPKFQALVYNILSPSIASTDYTICLRKLSANQHFFLAAQMALSLQQTTQIISGISFITTHVAYASTTKTRIVWIEMELFSSLSLSLSLFTQGRWSSCLCACLDTMLLPQSYQYPNLLECNDSINGKLRRDKERPFSGITNSGSLEEHARKRCSACTGPWLPISSKGLWTLMPPHGDSSEGGQRYCLYRSQTCDLSVPTLVCSSHPATPSLS